MLSEQTLPTDGTAVITHQELPKGVFDHPEAPAEGETGELNRLVLNPPTLLSLPTVGILLK